MNIATRQNKTINLKRLAAQRQIYSEAKDLLNIQFLVCVVAAIVFAILANILSDEFAIYPITGAILCVLFNEVYLSKRIKKLTTKAAYIQEEFDCDVLLIPKNRMKEDFPELLEIINYKSKKFLEKGNNYDLLKDWYPGIKEADISYGRIICQNTNCFWNKKLRERYSAYLAGFFWIIFILLLVISIMNDLTLTSFIGAVLAPLIPSIVFVYNIFAVNKDSITKLNHIKIKLNEIIEKLKVKEHYPKEQLDNDIRSLQDLIFENRLIISLTPDKFYFRYRDRDEGIAAASNEELIDLINNRIQ
ncbi:S-4TM family putative pore-forming effector [Paenisporosarcina macmurdoensis]|uniref:S-4TM family putative pore-forming effector n=1 Tax=Paenisporosarcina macmurdoensis TaxID=212659 RepID=A0ABW1LA78_9BACL